LINSPAAQGDYALLLVARVIRAFGFGFGAVLLGLHLERRGFSGALIGILLGIGLAAGSLSGLAFAALAARIGRRRALALAGVLMAITGLDLALATQPAFLLLAGVTGMLGVAGVDLGPFAAVEQAVLSESVADSQRNRAFGRYSLSGGLGAAMGSLAAAAATDLSRSQAFFLAYALIGIGTAALALRLSPGLEPAQAASAFPRVRPLLGLSALFALDALGGGFVANAVIAYWLHVRFGAAATILGTSFAGIAVLQAISYEVSGRLGDRIGLVRTMVFTHLPSNLLLLLVPFSPNLFVAISLLFARFSLSQMDVPARQAYVVSIVEPGERAGAVALTGAVRGITQSFGPFFAGLAIQATAFALPFLVGGGLKIVYDVGLYTGFRGRQGRHEGAGRA
jgi:MFS family permease